MIVSPEEERLYLRKIDRRLRELKERIYTNVLPIEDVRLRTTNKAEGVREALDAGGFRRARVGRRWGRPWQTAWFLFTFTVPEEWAGKPAVAILEPGGEAVAFLDGEPLQGLDANRNEILLSEDIFTPGETVTLAVEAGANDAFGRFQHPRTLTRADIALLIPELRAYWYDASVLIELAKDLPADSTRRARIIQAVNASVDAFDYDESDPGELARLAGAARKMLQPVLDQPAPGNEQHFLMQGHAHIDVAWLWPLWETVRKCARTFSTVDTYMREFPDYVFGQGQAQLYAFTKEHYPGLYERIRGRIEEGRWEVTGGTWVEMDCNIPSGESLIRQVVHGRRFFAEEFGAEPEIAWLPDVFGYPACLPQIFRKCGLNYFLTQKMSWNEFNHIPYHTFRWRGLDGTEILAHFPPTNTYNGRLTPQQMLTGARGFTQKGELQEQLYLFGFGDGGGGPTKQMLEYARRVKSLQGLPSSQQGKAHEFFTRAMEDWEKLPVWADELYNEFHRGTYTTQARTKRNNRKSELLYRAAELWGALAEVRGWSYPRERMDRGWKLILLNQFHDIVPGSSIDQVYKDSAEQFSEVFTIGEEARAAALAALSSCIDTGGLEHPCVVLNSLSWARSGPALVEAPGGGGPWQVVTTNGYPLATQVVTEGGKDWLLFQAPKVPPMGYETVGVRPAGDHVATDPELAVSTRKLENVNLRVRFNAAGRLTSVYDKQAEREVLARGCPGNQLQLFEDKPVTTDAWDIDFYYAEKPPVVLEASSVKVVAEGPVKAAVETTYRTRGGSTITQEVALYAGDDKVVFNTHVDWHETDKLLKAAFPVAVRSRRATYEIQFGHIDRPTHRSTSWDRARFEVPAQRWADLSEAGYGVSLLNDCKYGYDIKDNVVRLTLLRAPTTPDPEADRGEHRFSYALYPHAGDVRAAEVVRRGYEFNVPLEAVPAPPGRTGELAASHSFLSLDSDDVVLDTVKPAEDGRGIILRLYEAHGGRGKATLHFGFDVAEATECNCLERPLGDPAARSSRPVALRGNTLAFHVLPFEIKTFRVLAAPE